MGVIAYAPSWEMAKAMGYSRVWLMTAMDYNRVDCIGFYISAGEKTFPTVLVCIKLQGPEACMYLVYTMYTARRRC